MDRDSLLRPTGPLPASVYWLRRAGALAVALVAVSILVLLVSSLGGGGRRHPAVTADPSATVTAGSPAATATASATAPTTEGSCAPISLTLSVSTSATTYPPGTAPTFTAALRTSGVACLAPGPLSFVVTSGSDRVWSNTDCPAGSGPGPATALPAGGGASGSRTWQRTRSKPGCTAVNGTATALPGHYHVAASWAGATSAPATFVLQ